MVGQWKIGRKPMWVVLDEKGGPWMVSASTMTKRRSIAKFVRDSNISWRYWHRHGYRCCLVRFKFRTE